MNVRSILKSVAGWFGGKRESSGRATIRRATLTVENLEKREVPAFLPLAPNTFGWPLGGLAGDTRALAGASQANIGLSIMISRLNPQVTANGLFPNVGQTLLQSTPFGQQIGRLTATADTAQGVYMDPIINAVIQRDPTALYAVGAGATPQTYGQVRNQINAMPGTYGSMIDYTGTARLAGLDGRLNPEGSRYNLVPMMQTIQYGPGPAFVNNPYASQFGFGPNTSLGTASTLGGIFNMMGMGVPTLRRW